MSWWRRLRAWWTGATPPSVERPWPDGPGDLQRTRGTWSQDARARGLERTDVPYDEARPVGAAGVSAALSPSDPGYAAAVGPDVCAAPRCVRVPSFPGVICDLCAAGLPPLEQKPCPWCAGTGLGEPDYRPFEALSREQQDAVRQQIAEFTRMCPEVFPKAELDPDSLYPVATACRHCTSGVYRKPEPTYLKRPAEPGTP